MESQQALGCGRTHFGDIIVEIVALQQLFAIRHPLGHRVDPCGDHRTRDVSGVVAEGGRIVDLDHAADEFDMGRPDQPFIPNSNLTFEIRRRSRLAVRPSFATRIQLACPDRGGGNDVVDGSDIGGFAKAVDAVQVEIMPFFAGDHKWPAFLKCGPGQLLLLGAGFL